MTTTTAKKTTKKDLFKEILQIPAIANNEVYTDFIQHEIDLLENKKTASKKQTEQQKENKEIKDRIMVVLQNSDEPLSIREIKEKDDSLAVYESQKLSALITQLKKDNLVERIAEKGKAKFKAL